MWRCAPPLTVARGEGASGVRKARGSLQLTAHRVDERKHARRIELAVGQIESPGQLDRFFEQVSRVVQLAAPGSNRPAGGDDERPPSLRLAGR